MAEKKMHPHLPLTQEEFDKYVAIHDGDWWVEDVHGFYAVLKDGKVTVPKEVIEKLKLEDDEFVKLYISQA